MPNCQIPFAVASTDVEHIANFMAQLVHHVAEALHKASEDSQGCPTITKDESQDRSERCLSSWYVTVKRRTSGASGGSVDAYYHDPQDKRYRSRLEVCRALGIDAPTGRRSIASAPNSHPTPKTPESAWALARKGLR